MVDTGATQTSISKSLADELGIAEQSSAQFNTVNGTVRAGIAQATISLEGGLSFERQRIALMPQMEGVGLLGMDALGRLKLEQQGKELRISVPKS